MSVDGAEYSSASEYFVGLNSTIPKRKKSKNKRRFSDEQIRSLEVTFESDTKLEPNKKAQLAKELGLQPRQVAIWFQNKRARWKSKQIEKDYSILLADYNKLASQFEFLKKEKQSLLIQLQKLKNETVLGKSETKSHSCGTQETAGSNSNIDAESDNYMTKMDFEVKKNSGSKSLEGLLLSDDDDHSSIKEAELLGLGEENELFKMVEPAVDSSLTSSDQDWGSLDSDDLIINQPTENYDKWWDFWC